MGDDGSCQHMYELGMQGKLKLLTVAWVVGMNKLE